MTSFTLPFILQIPLPYHVIDVLVAYRVYNRDLLRCYVLLFPA